MILTNEEIEICKYIAKMREKKSRLYKITPTDPEMNNQHERDLNGIMGEIIAAKTFNLYPDFNTEPKSVSYDLIGKNNVKLEIKTTTYINGKLLVKPKALSNKSDYYILVILNKNKNGGKVAGYADKDMVFKDENIKSCGEKNVPRYTIEQINLKKI